MSNQAAAIRAAVLAERPRAVVSGRGRNWIRHYDPDTDRSILTSTVGPLHYDDAGWQEIDTTVGDSTDATFDDEVITAPYRVRVKDGNRRVWPRRDVADEWIDFGRPEFRRNNGQYAVIPWDGKRREDNTVIFSRADAELRVSFTSGRLKMNLILLSAPSSTRWRFPVSISGLTRQGARLVSNRDGTTVATLAPFELEDAAGIQRDIAGTFTSHPTYQGAYVIQPDLSGLTYPVVIDPTVDVSVAVGGDDGSWNNSGAFSSIASTGIEFGGNGRHTFMRFTGLSALDGATISAASITVTSRSNRSGTTLNMTISAAAADNQTAPTTNAECTSPTRTTASVAWNNIGAWTTGNPFTTPDLSTVVQEMADNGYLTSGVALFYWEDNASTTTATRTYASYEDATYTTEAALHVEYTSSQTVNPARLDAPATFYAPTIDEVVDIAARLDAPATFYQPTAATGIFPDRLDAAATFYQPTITERVNVSGRFDAAATFYQPTAAEGIAPARLDAPATFYAPAITERVNVAARFDVPATFYQPTAAYAAPRTGLLYTRIMQADALRITTDSSLALAITDSPVRLSTESSFLRVQPDAAPLRIRPE